MSDSVRIDKYLWAIRAFKTRTEATDACSGGKVKVAGTNCKPSRPVKTGEIIDVRKGSVQYSYRVVALLENRVGASAVADYAENLTPESELAKAHAPAQTVFVSRDRGSGRPTKKDRRTLDALRIQLEEDE